MFDICYQCEEEEKEFLESNFRKLTEAYHFEPEDCVFTIYKEDNLIQLRSPNIEGIYSNNKKKEAIFKGFDFKGIDFRGDNNQRLSDGSLLLKLERITFLIVKSNIAGVGL